MNTKLTLAAQNKTHPSTNERVLLELMKLHPVPGYVLQHRHLSKILNTYMDPMLLLAEPKRHTRLSVSPVDGKSMQPQQQYRIYAKSALRLCLA